MTFKTEEDDKLLFVDYSTRNLISDIGKYLKPYRWRFAAASLLRLSSDLVSLYNTYALALIVTFFSSFKPGDPTLRLWVIILIWGLAAVWKNSGRHLAKFIGYQVSEKVALDAQYKTIKHLFKLDMAWHEKENSGNKLKRIQKGSQGLDRILRMWIGNFIEIGVNFIGMIYILGRINSVVGLIMVAFLVVYFISSFSLLKMASKASQDVDIKEEEMMGLMFQTINNIRSVKVLAMSESILGIIKGKIKELFIKIKYRITSFQRRAVILEALAFSFRLGTLIFISLGIMHGNFQVGFLVLFYGYFNNLVQSATELSDTTQDFIIYKYAIARMQKIQDEAFVIDDDNDKTEFPKKWEKMILKDLSFAYGKQKVLKGISFEISKGEKIGIIGLSGAGKSTLMKLLLKENEDYQGDIFIDDMPLKKIKKNSYMNQVGVVLQDTEVFNFTLKDNVALAGGEETDEKILEESMRTAYVYDFVSRLPGGVDTFIGEKGVRLSGGERQRLGIARAIYKRPQILFLDEATSHLDLESEKKIKDSLNIFFKKVTAIVIAHRLTTLREMDRIMVIERGKIVESGSYEELYAKQGRFYELWNKQKL
jgi:ATP-binding cassette, subfamily B, heavy metal transporter